MSDEKKVEKKEKKECDQMMKRIAELEGQIEALKDEKAKIVKAAEENQKFAEDWKNKYYQVYADMANTRKQVEKETSDYKKYAIKSIVEELIPSLDIFDMALKNKPEDEKLLSFLKGFEMVQTKMINTLEQNHVTIITPNKGDEYDPNTMEAYSTIEGEEDNKVIDVYTKGYKMYDHLLRPSGVIISKKVEKKEEVEEKKAE